jgi:type IV secretion system protein VirB10
MTFWRRRGSRDSVFVAPSENTEPDVESSSNVGGERGIPPNHPFRSVQSRISGVFTVMVMIALAAGLLIYYYTHALGLGAKIHRAAELQEQRKAQGESRLPPFSAFHVNAQSQHARAPSTLDVLLGPPPVSPSVVHDKNPLDISRPQSVTSGVPAAKSQAQLAAERRLAGPVLVRSQDQPVGVGQASLSNAETPAMLEGVSQSFPMAVHEEGTPGNAATLETLLRPTAIPAATAQTLTTQRYLLPKGAFLDCTLETAVTSALPGMTTCITATDTFGADGTVVLLERGSKLIGETRGMVQAGSPRLFVLWTEARTPTGIVVPLASPGTDELGRSGLTGEIDWHWWQRFGTALLITVVDGTVQTIQERNNTSNVQVNPTGAGDVVAGVLRGTMNIPPTLNKPQGDRIQILVARDIDFRQVYSLRPRG